MFAALHAGHRLQGRRLVVQLHAGQHVGDQVRGHRLGGRGLVDLGHVALGRGLGVDEGAVVRHQEHARGVVVEAADRLHLAPGELFRQQGQHARMVAWFTRAFEVGRLVQRDVDMLAIRPFFVEHGQDQAIGVESGFVAVDGLAVDGDVAVLDQRAAIFAGAESLRLQDTV